MTDLASKPSRNEVRVDGDLARMTVETEEIIGQLNSSGPELFRLGEALVRVGGVENPKFEPMNPDRLRRYLAESIYWFTVDEKGKRKPAHPPMPVVRSVLAATTWPVPAVDRLTTVPLFAPDGTLVVEAGYFPQGRLFLIPTVRVPPVPVSPSEEELGRAVNLIVGEVLIDFPFVSPSDLAHTVAAMLLPFMRSMIVGPTPLHLVNAPAKGSGKSLLADVIRSPSDPVGGVMTGAGDKAEWRKRITAFLMDGRLIILLDNLHGTLDSDALAAVLTETMWSDRILGKSETVDLPNQALWLATGNGVTLSDELLRRTLPILLDAGMEEPHLRAVSEFKHADLKTWVRSSRADLIWACLTIGQTWVAAGRPPGSVSLGSFESWSATMGGILEVAGIDGFLGNLAEWAESGADPVTLGWRGLSQVWWTTHGEQEITVTEVLGVYDLVGEDFLDLVGGNDLARSSALGKALVRKRDAVIGVYKLCSRPKSGSNRYRLMPLPKG